MKKFFSVMLLTVVIALCSVNSFAGYIAVGRTFVCTPDETTTCAPGEEPPSAQQSAQSDESQSSQDESETVVETVGDAIAGILGLIF